MEIIKGSPDKVRIEICGVDSIGIAIYGYTLHIQTDFSHDSTIHWKPFLLNPKIKVPGTVFVLCFEILLMSFMIYKESGAK